MRSFLLIGMAHSCGVNNLFLASQLIAAILKILNSLNLILLLVVVSHF